jgi:hypothetical protein
MGISMTNGFSRLLRFLVSLAAMLSVACTYKVVTPPARTGFFGSPAILPEEKSAYTAEGTGAGQIFSGYLEAGSLTYHRGLGQRNELQVTPGFARVQDSSNLYSLSLDMKKGEEENGLASFTYGAGYIYSKYGQALSSQVGMLLGYENRYLVPTFSVMLLASQPFATRSICGYDEGAEETECAKPTFTMGVRFGFSAELKLPGGLSVIPSLGFAPLHSQTHSLAAVQAALAVRWGP